MATLHDLWRAVFPQARPATETTAELALGREVTWVRVLKARVPAFEALEPGDLAILPESALATLTAGSVEPATLVEAIAAAGVAGALLVGDGAPRPGGVETLRQATTMGVPALRLTAGDVGALERAIIGYLVDARGELERQASRLEAELERLALAEGDLAAYAAAISDYLDRPVAIEGSRGQPLAVHAPAGRPAAVAEAARYLARPQRVALRTPLADVGSLALLGERPPSELERAVAARIGGLLAIAIGRGEGPRSMRGTPGREEIPGAGPPWVLLMARQLLPDQALSLEERQRARDRLRRLGPARRLGLRGDATSLELRAVVVPEPEDPLALAFAARAASAVGRTVAVSRPFRRVEERPLAEAEARATLEAFEALRPGEAPTGGRSGGPHAVARADRLPAYRLLGTLHNLPDGVVQAEALLSPLLGGRARAREQRLATLRAVLDEPDLTGAAAVLGIHRNTLAYRRRRIEALTGWQLDEPELRFVLGLAVRLVLSAQ